MPFDMQVTTFFETVGGNPPGFSETYYLKDAAETNFALYRATVIGRLRAALLGSPATLVPGDKRGLTRINEVRVSRLDTIGDSRVTTGAQQAGLFDGRNVGPSDIVNTRLVLRVDSGNFYHRAWMLGGIPDDLVVFGGSLVQPIPALWGGKFQDWVTEMISGARVVPDFDGILAAAEGGTPCFRVRNKVPPIPITSIVNNGATGLVVSTAPNPHNFKKGDRVKINRVIWAGVSFPLAGFQNKAPSGIYYVKDNADLTPTTFGITTIPPKKEFFAGSYRSGGEVSTMPLRLVPFSSISIERPGSRKGGRIFGEPVGRRRGPTRV